MVDGIASRDIESVGDGTERFLHCCLRGSFNPEDGAKLSFGLGVMAKFKSGLGFTPVGYAR